jgi:hypothetical protein
MNIAELKMHVESIKTLIADEQKGNKTNKANNILVYQNRLEELNNEIANIKPEVKISEPILVVDSAPDLVTP